MDASTKQVLVTVGGGILKKVLMLQAAGLVSHGLISSNNTETFVSLGMAAGGALWSLWDDFGRAIVLSKLAVWKAQALAQAAKLDEHGIAPVTQQQIADQSPVLTVKDVAKVVTAILVCMFVMSIGSANAQIFKKPATPSAPGVAKATPLADFLTNIAKIRNQLINDTQNADALAGAVDPTLPGGVKDPLAHQCYPAQVRWLQTLPDLSALNDAKNGNGADIGLGVITKYEILRMARLYAQNGFPPDLKMNCAAMIQDDIQFGLKFAALFGVTLGTGGAGGILGLPMLFGKSTPLGQVATRYASLHTKKKVRQVITIPAPRSKSVTLVTASTN